MTSNSNYRPLHPFDSVYTVIFIILMYYILGSTIGEIYYLYQNDENIKIEALFYNILVSVFFVYQLSRMYFYLKNFEDIIVKKGNHHFLEILPVGYQSSEKIIRLILAFSIVLFSKFQTKMDLLSMTLIFCFFVLIVWDVIVIRGLKKTIKQNKSSLDFSNETYKTAKSFFYLSDSELIGNRIYTFKTKFWERFFGLFASVTAYIYQQQGDSSNGIYIWVFSGFVIFFVLTAYYGKFKIKELELTDIDEFVDDLVRPFYLPIYKLLHNLNLIK